MRDIKVLSVVVILFCCSLVMGGELEEGLLFYTSFDKGVKADISRGNPEPISLKGNIQLEDGIKGKSIITGNDFITTLSYSTEGNFNITRGTISIWIKPIDWLGDKGKAKLFHIFMLEYSNQGYLGIEMERFNTPYACLLFYASYFPNREKIHIRYSGTKNWENGIWHHVVITWDNKEVRLYIDGVFIGRGQLTAPFTASDLHAKYFYIGTGGEEHTSIDEFRIWERDLTYSEVFQLYQKEKAGIN